jgi:MerR family transcriptional regulator, light-induced transcriptional regulator
MDMAKQLENGSLTLNISTVERETGLSKDVLRMWERRYGFPQPARDDNGERQYTAEEVAKLRAIKRLMDIGLRPGRIIHNTPAELNAMGDERSGSRGEPIEAALERDVLEMLRTHDLPALAHTLSNLLMRSGLQRFVLETVSALNRAVGEAWMRGDLQGFEEHLYTEQVIILLRAAINPFPRIQGTPRVLLTTLPGEQHALSLLMVEALLMPEGAYCISLGVQTPLEDIRRAAMAHNVHLIALSFSGTFPVRQAGEALAALRRHLPQNVTLWAGGEMTRRIRRTLPGVVLIPDLAAAIGALKSWRASAPQAASLHAVPGLR